MKKFHIITLFTTALLLFSNGYGQEDKPLPLTFVSENILPIRLWDKSDIPFSVPSDAGKKEKLVKGWNDKRRVSDITVPEIYPFFADGRETHPAVIVAPGGGYSYLSWEHEGIDICRWLQKHGFTAFLLKYRCPGRRLAARADMARAIRLIRSRAGEFRIDPAKIGVIGFSAGAHLCAAVSAAPEEPYPAADEVDKQDFRPDFTALIYPAFLLKNVEKLTLSDEFKVDKNTPPTLLIQTGDDPIKVDNSLGWYRALHKAGVPCEMHIWPTGGHGYGLWLKDKPVSDWHLPALKWFRRVTEPARQK